MKKNIVVPGDAAGMRLDKFLAGRLDVSRTKINNLIVAGKVVVDKKCVKPSLVLKEAQEIAVSIEKEKNQLRPYDFKVKIVYEDKDIIVVDKPTGLVTHPPQKRYHKTLVNALINLDKELFAASSLRPGVVHRLDKETSGIIVLAKNEKSYHGLIDQFRARSIKKEYCALVWGIIEKDNLNVNMPLARDKKNRLKMKVSLLGAKEAYTEIEVVKRLKGATLLSIKPRTGRMHQIRVHLKFLGFPIVGDKKYGIKDEYRDLLLHARKITFLHPDSGKKVSFSSPLPERFASFIKENS